MGVGRRIAFHIRSNDKPVDATFAGLAVQSLQNGTLQCRCDRIWGRNAAYLTMRRPLAWPRFLGLKLAPAVGNYNCINCQIMPRSCEEWRLSA